MFEVSLFSPLSTCHSGLATWLVYVGMFGRWLPYWTAQLWDLFGQLIESALRKRSIYLIYLIMVLVVAHGIFGCSMQDLVP